jgi:predicted RNA-binding Zn-ribbon protein involved in translation (DUF1610 family)
MPAKHCPKCGSFIGRVFERKQKKFKSKGSAGGIESYGVHVGYKCKKCGYTGRK